MVPSISLRQVVSSRLLVALVAMLAAALLLASLTAWQVARADHEGVIPNGDVPALIDAIIHANAEGGTVVLAENGEYVLTAVDNQTDGANGLPNISGTVTIEGNGATIRRSSVESTPDFRIFRVAPTGNLTLNDVSLSEGSAQGAEPMGDGGAIRVEFGQLTLTNSTVSSNSAGRDGGGIYNQLGTVSLTNSTVSGNSAGQDGGGIGHYGGTLTVINSTVSGNSAGQDGGGIRTSTITLNLINSVIAENEAETSPNIHGNITSQSNSFTSGDPGLGPLQYNGGPTQTMAPEADSPLIDGVDESDCDLANDQRGVPRPQGEDCDIGAVEVVAFDLDLTLTGPDTGTVGTAVTLDFNLSDASLDPAFAEGWIAVLTDGGGGEQRVAFDAQGEASADVAATWPGPMTVTATLLYDPEVISDTHEVLWQLAPLEIIHVDASNPSTTQDGATWATAFTDLQDGLALAEFSTGTFDTVQVWVAAGTYYPTDDDDRTVSFELRNNVALYGGFPAGGGDNADAGFDDRDWDAHETILSGNIGAPDSVSDNSLTVVLGQGVTQNVVLDGFTIAHGNANGTISADFPQPAHAGGGVFLLSTNLLLRNSTIMDHASNSWGAGISMSSSTLALENTRVRDNRASRSGGGIHVFNGTLTLINSSATGNSTDSFGGGIENFGGAARLINSVVSGNRANSGGGIGNAGNGSLVVTNSTVSGNAASGQGGGIEFEDGSLALSNSIVWGNQAATNPTISPGTGTRTASYSLIQGGCAALGVGATCDAATVFDADPLFIDWIDPSDENWEATTEGNYRLLPGSPAIDAGNNALYAAAFNNGEVETDLDGNPRIVPDPDGPIDLGPYEAQPTEATLTLDAPASSVVGTNALVEVAVAADGVDPSLFEGQVVILSGHNGPTEISLDEHGQGSTTVSTTVAGPMQLTATLGTLSNQATITWLAGPPAALDLVAEPAELPVGQFTQLTATVTDAFGNVVEDGMQVAFTLVGTNEGFVALDPVSGTTVDGVVNTSYSGLLPGSDTVTASVVANPQVSDAVTVTWNVPASTLGATVTAFQAQRTLLSLTARTNAAGTASGAFAYRVPGASLTSLRIDSVVVQDRTAIVLLTARVNNGPEVPVRLDLQSGAASSSRGLFGGLFGSVGGRGTPNTIQVRWPGYDSGQMTVQIMTIRP